MTGKPADEPGLTPSDEAMAERMARVWAMSPEQQRRTLALIERIEASELN